jgi:indole-3-glycerol phosphate synthase
LELDAVVEVHTETELFDVLDVGAEIIGVNNRNLSTMQLCMDTSLRLAPLLPKEKVKIAESGINSSNYIKELEKIGFDAALVGEALLRAEDAERKMEQWLR